MAVDIRWPLGPSDDPGCRPPRALYLHIPFCRRHCGYCNFTVAAARDDLHGRYAEALRREIRQGQPGADASAGLRTLFLGGGTPSQMNDALLASVLEGVYAAFPSDSLEETTLEANPEDLTPRRIDAWASLGVKRISLGVQSFQADKLRVLEREHDADQARRAAEAARDAGLQVAIDLIFAAPGETCDQWRRDLQDVLALRPDHVSTYGMTFEKGAAFWGRLRRGDLESVAEETELLMYQQAIDQLTGGGYEHYEVSNFALPGASAFTIKPTGLATRTMASAPAPRG